MQIDKYDPDIHAAFLRRQKADEAEGLVQPWMTSWYWKELFPQFGSSQGYRGPQELVGWIHGQSTARLYHNPTALSFLLERAAFQEQTEREVLGHSIFAGDPRLSKINYANHALYSTQDFFFQTLREDLLKPIHTVVDFGSGCGRMAPQWLRRRNASFVSIEGIPQTYCIQHLFYALLGAPFSDYMVQPNLEVDFKPNHIYHIPSWRMELMPDASVDLVSVVQVLGELRPEMLEHVIDHFARILRPGGILYVRDHGARHNPNKMDIPATIGARGFELEYVAPYEDLKEIHGVPKIWRKPI